jgi:aminoglycoside phosphotransferase (APT) family kinase protein
MSTFAPPRERSLLANRAAYWLTLIGVYFLVGVLFFYSGKGKLARHRRVAGAATDRRADLPIATVEVDGWDNRTFRLGWELTIRLPSGDWYAKQVDKEQRWLPVLAPQLPLPIPTPVARGEPDAGYPYRWSVHRWLEGEVASKALIGDVAGFAADLAAFLNALGRVDATDGPVAGEHNWFWGAPLGTYQGEAVEAIDALGDEIRRDDVQRA